MDCPARTQVSSIEAAWHRSWAFNRKSFAMMACISSSLSVKSLMSRFCAMRVWLESFGWLRHCAEYSNEKRLGRRFLKYLKLRTSFFGYFPPSFSYIFWKNSFFSNNFKENRKLGLFDVFFFRRSARGPKSSCFNLQYSRKSNQVAKKRTDARFPRKDTFTQRVKKTGHRNRTSDLV